MMHPSKTYTFKMLKRYFSYLYQDTAKNSTNYLLSILEFEPNAKLLDCGCWDGTNTLRYGARVGSKNLYGIEIYKPKVKSAIKKGVKVKLGNLDKRLPFPDQSFDVVVGYHVIEHLINVRRFASELYRILKKGGYAVIGTPNLASWHNIFALLLGIQPFSGPTIYPNYESDIAIVSDLNKQRTKKVFPDYYENSLQHIKVMTARALVTLFKNHKFKIENLKGFGYYPLPPLISRPLSSLDPYHSHYIVIKVRKG